jgi:hypothetical protein
MYLPAAVEGTMTIITTIFLMVENHVSDMPSQREWRNGKESLVLMHMNDNLIRTKRRVIARSQKGVIWRNRVDFLVTHSLKTVTEIFR